MLATKKNIYFLSRNEEVQLEGEARNPGGGGHSREVWVEVCRQGLQTPTLFKT